MLWSSESPERPQSQDKVRIEVEICIKLNQILSDRDLIGPQRLASAELLVTFGWFDICSSCPPIVASAVSVRVLP